MPRPTFLPADPKAVALALRAIQKTTGQPAANAIWRLSAAEKQSLRDGKPITVKQNTVLAQEIVGKLLDALEGAHNEHRAEQLRTSIRTAFGERAFEKAVGVCRREKEQEARCAALSAPKLPQRALFGQGTHVAPFLSPSGGIVLVTLNRWSYLAFMAECGRPAGGQSNTAVEANEFTAKTEIDLSNSAEDMMAALRGEIKEKLDGRSVSPYGWTLLRGGIHYAPWKPWNRPKGFTLVAIDKQHRLVASMDASDPEGAREARRELSVLLEILAPDAYQDPYDDGFVDDDSCGESWKRE